MKKNIIFLLMLLSFLSMANIGYFSVAQPFKGLGKTTRINIYSTDTGDLVVVPYMPGFLRYRIYYDDYDNHCQLWLNTFNRNGMFTGQKTHNFEKYNFMRTFQMGNKLVALLEWHDKDADLYNIGYTVIDCASNENVRSKAIRRNMFNNLWGVKIGIGYLLF